MALSSADVLPAGLEHDRRFMLLGAENEFLTQRSHPRLALVETAIADGMLALAVQGVGRVTIPLDDAAYRDAPRRRTTVWDDEVECVTVPGRAVELLSEHLGERCTLVYMPDDVVRGVERPHGRPGDRVGFADAYPVLVAALASLADVNEKLAARGEPPVTMDRFRPNLVVEGGAPWDEERFARANVGALALRMPKRCSRCEVTTVDQRTAAVGKEPLRTLATFRKDRNKVYFAQNAIPDAPASIAVGDAVVYSEPIA